jgi:hypothetical protein
MVAAIDRLPLFGISNPRQIVTKDRDIEEEAI